MNFSGFVMSDWEATHSSDAILHGLDMDMPGDDPFFQYQVLLDKNRSKPLYTAARRILASMFHLRLEEADSGCTPPLCIKDLTRNVTSPKHRSLALETAAKAVVLLKNHGDILPLNTSKIRKLGVVGNAADAGFASVTTLRGNVQGLPEGDYYSGGGSGHVQGSNATLVTTLEAITRRAAAENITVLSANTTAQHNSSRPLDTLLKEVDLVVVVAGAKTTESKDRSSLHLDDGADDLIRRVSKEKPTIVLLMIPGTILMPWHAEVDAIAVLFYGGEASGEALSAILFADRSPVGKLPIMIPMTEADTIEPAKGNVALYSEGLLTSYRNHSHKALFPFGWGLAYTHFKYHLGNMMIEHKLWMDFLLNHQYTYPGPPGRLPFQEHIDVVAAVCISVENIGNYSGSEVVQGYIRFPKVPDHPHLQLRSFRRTKLLQPGQKEQVWLHFNRRELSVYDPQKGWILQDEALLFMGVASVDLSPPLLLSAKNFGHPVLATTTSLEPTGSARPASKAKPATTKSAELSKVSTSSRATPVSGGLSTTPSVLKATKAEPTEAPPAAPPWTAATTTETTQPSLHAEPGPRIPSVPGPTAPPKEVHATDANNWVLYAVQPALLLLVVLCTVLATRGTVIDDSDSDGPKSLELMMEAEELPTWEYVYQGDGVSSPLIRTSDGRVHTRAPL